MAESKAAEQPTSVGGRLKRLIVPALIFAMAAAIVVAIAGNWNAWASEKAAQETDDAYTRADLTPLSTKVAGLVGTVAVTDYQSVKTGDLLVQLRDDDFRAQVQQAQAGVASGDAALINNQRQKELQCLLATPTGRQELLEIECRYHAISGKVRPKNTSVITYILVHERVQGLLGK